jgi:hypothetical protein
MKYLLILAALSLSACSTITIHSSDDPEHQMLDQHKGKITIIGNPHCICYNRDGEIVADGIFVRGYWDGSILVDEYGKRYVRVYRPDCDLNPSGPRK